MLEDSDIQRFVACLVLGYLDNQLLQSAYDSFIKTSRHLTKEKDGLQEGNKPLDTSKGLVNIVRDYFLFQSRINDFLRRSPNHPVVIKLIDTDDPIQRLDIILKSLKDHFDRVTPSNKTLKRKLTKSDDEFNVSQTNTSTPDSLNPPKRLKSSLTTPFLTLSANKKHVCRSVEKPSTSRGELNYQSTSDTSEKEDDDVEEEGDHSPMQRSTASPTAQVLKEKKFLDQVINDKGMADQVANLINKTLSAQQLDPGPCNSSESQEKSTGQNILSVTQNEEFDVILNDVINKYLFDFPAQESVQTSTSTEKLSTESETAVNEEIPIKQRLRPRCERSQPIQARKPVNIISDELLPAVANLTPMTTVITAQPNVLSQLVYIENGNEIIPLIQTIPNVMPTADNLIISETLGQIPTSSTMICQNAMISEQGATIEKLNEPSQDNAEKKESTPKITLYPSFLESKSKSTPRRKAQHVRILDFNQTPSNRRMSTIKEFTTPANGIPHTTPGSAPASVNVTKSAGRPEVVLPSQGLDDENSNSNSNSISHTPKVSKQCRVRKIAVQKSEEKVPGEEELKKPANVKVDTNGDWNFVRTQFKSCPIDQLMRLQNQEAENNSPKKRSRKTRQSGNKSVAKKRTPKKRGTRKVKKEKETSPSTEIDENKPLSSMKFKISSPRKVAAKKLSKKKTSLDRSKEKRKPKSDEKSVETIIEESNELNRSDTVQEVAMVLTNFPETILARHKSTEEIGQTPQADNQNSLLVTPCKDMLMGLNETPFKSLMTPLPNTPRFAIPISTSSHETPMPKIFASSNTTVTLQSIVKNCDIPTPSFPITPGFKLTPLKELQEESPAGGYCNRRTDYSSSSSYYRPDESEEINQKINAIISQSKCEDPPQTETTSVTHVPAKILPVVKTVDCPAAIDRMRPSTSREPPVQQPRPHYRMMDEEALLSESFITTATEESSSSQFTCSTCSTSDSSSQDTLVKIDKLAEADTEEKDSDWGCDDPDVRKDGPLLVNANTGEVRFPLRNLITPKKTEIDSEQAKIEDTNKIKEILNNPARGLSIEEERARVLKEQEAVKKRTLAKIRSETAAFSAPNHKFKKSQVKNFKLPAETSTKPAYVSRKDQILNQQFQERPRPTPLKLIPSNNPSRRKNATPRKTIPMNELPREQSSKKQKIKAKVCAGKPSTEQSPVGSNDDNAIMPEDSTSLEVSSSFNTSNEEETASTVIEKQTTTKPNDCDEGSNTFQRTLIAQGFKKNEAKELQSELFDKLESTNDTSPSEDVNQSSTTSATTASAHNSSQKSSLLSSTVTENDESETESDSDEEELANENEKRVFCYEEPEKFTQCSSFLQQKILSVKCRIDQYEVHLADTGNIDLFSLDPEENTKPAKAKKNSPRKIAENKSNGKASSTKIGSPKAPRSKPSARCENSGSSKSIPIISKAKPLPEQPQTVPDVNAILATIHGK